MRMHRLALLCLLAALAAPTRAAAADVWVVGPGDYVWTALDQAQPGDLILIKSGALGTNSFIISKAVSLVAESGADVTLFNVAVSNVPAGGSVILRGLHITSAGFTTLYPEDWGLVVDDCEGTVRFEDCLIDGGSPSAVVMSSDSVVFSRCTLVGSEPLPSPGFPVLGPAGDGLRIVDSVVRLEACDVRGGNEVNWPSPFPDGGIVAEEGAPAVRLYASELFVAGSTLTGGAGADGVTVPFTNECWTPPGGPGLLFGSTGGIARVLDTSIAPGPSGNPHAGCPAVPTSPDVEGPGTFVPLTGTSSTLVSSAPLREGEATTLTIEGTPGDFAFLLLAAAPADFYLSKPQSVLLVDPAAFVAALGPLPASGALTLPATVPAMIPSLEWLPLFAQGATVGPGGAVRLGAPSALVLLDGGL